MSRPAPQFVVLAGLANGKHVVVGKPSTHEGAHALHTALDSDLTGFVRENGRLRFRPEQAHTHTIKGQDVRLYRVREADAVNLCAEFARGDFGLTMVSLSQVGRSA